MISNVRHGPSHRMARSAAWLVKCFLAAALMSGLLRGAEANLTRPNIVFILIDTVRRDHVGCYNYPRDTTPHLDAFAKQGAKFECMIATSSWTLPSLMSMFTALPPSLHQATTYMGKLARHAPTLAGELKAAGYQTAAVVSNPTANSRFGFGSGFDLYDDYTCSLPGELTEAAASQAVTSPIVNRAAMQWLDKQRDPKRPFFLFALYFDTHADYVPPPPYDTQFDPGYTGSASGKEMYYGDKSKYGQTERKHVEALYDGELRFVDEHVGALLAKLDTLGISRDALVVIASDHGEEFWDHGKTLHGHTLYDELIRVPFLIRWPDKIKPGQIVLEQYSLLGLMPTLLEAAGINKPQRSFGVSFLAPLLGKTRFVEQPAYFETQIGVPLLRGLRTSTHKLLWEAGGRKIVFDLAEDSKETLPRTISQTGQAVLSERLENWWKRIDVEKQLMENPQQPELRQKLLEQLRDLGYTQ